LVLIESSIKLDPTGINSNQIFVSENKKYYAVTAAGHVANIKSIKHFLPQVLQPESKGGDLAYSVKNGGIFPDFK